MMYVCICKAVTDREIRNAVAEGQRTMRGLRKQLGCTGQCGKCAPQVRAIRDEVVSDQCAITMPALALSQ
jgi:bacterioferritin-associated ferredoxin